MAQNLFRMAENCQIFFISLIIFTVIIAIDAWKPDIQLNLLKTDKRHPIFIGNTTDYFKILDQDENTILIGARNAIYNLSVTTFDELNKLEWSSPDADRELCSLKGKHENDCQNYIRVFARIDENEVMICGTNSYKPRCRTYLSSIVDNDDKSGSSAKTIFEVSKDDEAQGRCPYNPTHNSTYIFTDGRLYSATVADFSSADPLIYREPLRTEQYDLKQLNQPDFVSAIERDGYVFFFFREIAMEYMNCGKAIYSRVGRVCKNDHGGPYASSERWTSFLKTRLNCSVPGEYPFYFDEIQGTSKIIDAISRSHNRSSIIYGVFTTSINAIPGSAVCAFSIDDILDAFGGSFKEQKDANANWLPRDTHHIPRPGTCVDDSRTLSSTAVNFVKTHTLMETAVPAIYGKPLLTRVSLQHRLTSIAVHPNLLSIDGNYYDVIFVGTDDGKIIKFMNIPPTSEINSDDLQTVVISEVQALTVGTPVREITIAFKTESLIVVGDGQIIALPLHHCNEILHCQKCIDLRDPYCVWDVNNHECVAITKSKTMTSDSYIQNLNTTTKISQTMCRKFGDAGNRIDQRPIVIQSTRGTVSAVGKSLGANGININSIGGGALAQSGINSIDGGYGGNYNTDNKITLTSVNSDDLMHFSDSSIQDEYGVEGERIQLARGSVYWVAVVIIVLVFVFGIGILVGLYVSRRICKGSAFHTERRNQLSPKPRPFTHRNSGKDINLLMNTKSLSVPCNNKKDNLEHEFVGEKDRSHECKNSTENLEKEVHCKTSTLTKVKRTYI